jgi:hypothetical protein
MGHNNYVPFSAARGGSTRAEFPLYHTPSYFVNRHFAQKFYFIFPKICALLLIYKLKNFCYNNICKEIRKALKNK